MDNEKERLEGFNAGYIIETHNPELAKHLKTGINQMNDSFAEGFIAGSEESIKDKDKVVDKGMLKGIQLMKSFSKGRTRRDNKSKNKDRDIDIDR